MHIFFLVIFISLSGCSNQYVHILRITVDKKMCTIYINIIKTHNLRGDSHCNVKIILDKRLYKNFIHLYLINK